MFPLMKHDLTAAQVFEVTTMAIGPQMYGMPLDLFCCGPGGLMMSG